ncbi:glycosyltransferase family 61 protein [Aeromicrobium sp. UC242_57]|uniref:glycosyltransferase family 61 protein n=1 Tax=Aeromicrobium sp. UC242_57 TaxID=3374624 RepID=UPI0037B4BE78
MKAASTWPPRATAPGRPAGCPGLREARRQNRRRTTRTELVTSVETLPTSHGLGAVRKLRGHYFTLRHDEVEATLAQRYGDDWGDVMVTRDAYRYDSRADLVMHGEPAPREKQPIIEVPALSVRRYAEATCRVREIVTRDNLILPDSFRHWNSPQLFHKQVIAMSKHFGRLVDEVEHTPVRRVDGGLFSFDSAFPTHFGHLTTETISHLWGWEHAVAANPDLRVVMTHQAGKKALPSWKAAILQALGVPTDSIEWVTEHEAVQAESLVAAMPQLENPFYVDRDLTATWARLYDGLGADPDRDSRPEKIFVSRRAKSQRYCTNAPEVEAFMQAQGYTVVLPEKMPYTEQAHTFSAAKVIAGFAGSGLFNMMFSPSARIVILTSQNYVAANEYLFASATGNEIHYFWACPQVERPEHGNSVDAYRSDFTFPLDEHREALTKVLR